jgi:glycosyltransferase involved in cell wall biosynthesis
MHDNTLVTALRAQGHDAILMPTYTPIRTDEADVSQPRVFFGGINVYLQQKLSLFRHTPWILDRILDQPGLLRWVSRFAVRTEADQLGDLTLSMLQGEHGHQRKEIEKLTYWLANEHRPQIICLTNALLSGLVPMIKERVGVPILCTLQGDDIFLESLPAIHREQSIKLIGEHCQKIDGFIATCDYYANFMAGYLDIPRQKIHVIYPGLNLTGHGGERPVRENEPFTIGYFARICPEKGFHLLVEAYIQFRKMAGAQPARLRASGWLGENNRSYFEKARRQLDDAGLGSEFEHVDCPDHAGKVLFLHGIDVLSVPTVYREPKGLYVLEALANGTPVVQPRHGSFPELLNATSGGLLVQPEDPKALAEVFRQLVENPGHRLELGRKGKEAVHQRFHAERMAAETADLYRKYL